MANALECKLLRIVSRDTGVALVEDVSLTVKEGELVGLVGESGSGKTTVGFAFLGFARLGTRIASGSVRVGDADPFELGASELLALRRKHIAYVPQSAGYALNPALRIGRQLYDRLGSGR